MRALVLLALASACASAPRPATSELPRDLVERYRGHVVVLDFWAGWCTDCRRQVPQLARLAAAFAQDGLEVVGVNAGESASDASAAALELGITYHVELDPELAFSDRMGAASLPALLVVDRSGVIVHRSRHLDEQTIAVIRRLLHAPSAKRNE